MFGFIHCTKFTAASTIFYLFLSLFFVGQSSCSGNDCKYMCLPISSHHYSCSCPDSLADSSCNEESKYKVKD